MLDTIGRRNNRKLKNRVCLYCKTIFRPRRSTMQYCGRACAKVAGAMGGWNRGKHVPAIERFWKHIRFTPYCWIWEGARAKGYGHFICSQEPRRWVSSHRYAYLVLRGEIPENMVLDHAVCKNPSCVNPWHLEVVTVSENTQRDPAWRFTVPKTHCIHGHEFTIENTVRIPKGRACRACQKEHSRRYWIENRDRLTKLRQERLARMKISA